MKLDLIGGDSLEQIDCLFIVIVFSFGKSDQQLVIARFAHDAIFPFRIRDLLVGFWLLAFLNQIRVPSRNIVLRIRGDPKVAFELGRYTPLPRVSRLAPRFSGPVSAASRSALR